jgi:hypothetical protein
VSNETTKIKTIDAEEEKHDENQESDRKFESFYRMSSAEKQMFKAKKNHPYRGLKTGKPRMSTMILAIKTRGSFNALKESLKDSNKENIPGASKNALQVDLFGHTSTEDEDPQTTTASYDHSGHIAPCLNNPEMLHVVTNKQSLDY